MSTTDASKRTPLDRDAIVRAGIELADAEGVGVLTMRRVADHLGFKAMALYNHISSKEDLLKAMLDAIATEIDEPPPECEPMQAIRQHAIATRDAFLRHPWAAGLWGVTMPGESRTAHIEYLLSVLARSDLDAETAHDGFHAINNHVLGYSMQEQALTVLFAGRGIESLVNEFQETAPVDRFPHTNAHLQEHLDGNTSTSFELVLDLILEGLARVSKDRTSHTA